MWMASVLSYYIVVNTSSNSESKHLIFYSEVLSLNIQTELRMSHLKH